MLELTYDHDGRSYEIGTGYGHIAVGVDDLDATLARLEEQGTEPEREPYRVRDGGSRIPAHSRTRASSRSTTERVALDPMARIRVGERYDPAVDPATR